MIFSEAASRGGVSISPHHRARKHTCRPPARPPAPTQGVRFYTPEHAPSIINLLIAGERVVAVNLDQAAVAALAPLPCTRHLDFSGEALIAVPGLVDMHVHAAGGGGEASFCSRTPEAQLSELINAGITTLVSSVDWHGSRPAERM